MVHAIVTIINSKVSIFIIEDRNVLIANCRIFRDYGRVIVWGKEKKN